MDIREDVKETLAKIENARASGLKIVLCHGVFDVVHRGHLEHFRQAKELGNVLVVSVTSDEFVNKGPDRPIFNLDSRIEFLRQIKYVDFVIPSYSPLAIENLSVVKPDFYVKGKEYSYIEGDLTGKISEELVTVQKYGGKSVFTTGLTFSSSNIINLVLNENKDWAKWVRENQSIFLTLYNEELFQRALATKVLILGETIIDRYTFCRALGKASKDPVLVFEERNKQDYGGGVLAIARHLSQLTNSVSVFADKSNLDQLELNSNHPVLDFGLNCISGEAIQNDIIIKHRFVDDLTGVKVFETYSTKHSPMNRGEHYYNKLKLEIDKSDIVIVADYGHGFFDQQTIEIISNSKKYIAVNCQSNAGSRGFNSLSRYSRANLVALNSGELELEFRLKNLEHEDYARTVIDRMNCEIGILTLGRKGLKIVSRNGSLTEVPALGKNVVDRIGAGDAVLAISSILGFLECQPEIIGLMASLLASHQVSTFGQANALTWGDLRKQGKSVTA